MTRQKLRFLGLDHVQYALERVGVVRYPVPLDPEIPDIQGKQRQAQYV